MLLWRDLNAGHIQRIDTGMYVAANSELAQNASLDSKRRRGRKRKQPDSSEAKTQEKPKADGRKSKRKVCSCIYFTYTYYCMYAYVRVF